MIFNKHAMVWLCLAFATPAIAGIDIETVEVDEGNIGALLQSTHRYFVDAMGEIVSDKYPGIHGDEGWARLRTSMEKVTVSRFKYTWTKDGKTYTKTYHSVSGAPLSVQARYSLAPNSIPSSPSHGSSSPRTPQTPSTPRTPSTPLSPNTPSTPSTPEWPQPGQSQPTLNYTEVDATDDRYYHLTPEETNVRARNVDFNGMPSDPRRPATIGTRSVIKPYDVAGHRTSADAEVKFGRTLEYDIRSHAVEPGGQIEGWVSKQLCRSCLDVMKDLNRHFDIHGTVTELKDSLPEEDADQLVKEGKVIKKGQRGILYITEHPSRPYLANRASFEDRRAATKDLIESLRRDNPQMRRFGSFRSRFRSGMSAPKNPDIAEEPGPSSPPGC